MEGAVQICFMEVDGKIVFFKEAEAVCELKNFFMEEETSVKRKKQTSKKEHDMSRLPITTIHHYMSEEELTDEFGPNGWKQLPDSIARRYIYIPAKIGVEEHHIGVYSSKLKGLSADERLLQRQVIIKPRVDALFVCLKRNEQVVLKSQKRPSLVRHIPTS